MQTKPLWSFPVPSTSISSGVILVYPGCDAHLRYYYYDEARNDAIFLDGYGLYEFIARGYRILDSKQGSLDRNLLI